MWRLFRKSKPEGKTFRLRPFDPETGRLAFGLFEDGSPAALTLRNQSGCVVGGVPGAGKSAGMTVIALALLMSGCARLHILDGKGGVDWGWASSAAADYYSGDDPAAAAELLKGYEQAMRRRLTELPRCGNSNYWNLPADRRPPLEVLIVDECQTFFSDADQSDKSKENKIATAACRAAATTIVKRGRSAGWIAFVLTQKPTADSIPTALRDNCGVRVAFRVMTREAGEAILGPAPAGAPSPLDVPAEQRGGCVLADDAGRWRRARFAYVDEGAAGAFVRSHT